MHIYDTSWLWLRFSPLFGFGRCVPFRTSRPKYSCRPVQNFDKVQPSSGFPLCCTSDARCRVALAWAQSPLTFAVRSFVRQIMVSVVWRKLRWLSFCEVSLFLHSSSETKQNATLDVFVSPFVLFFSFFSFFLIELNGVLSCQSEVLNLKKFSTYGASGQQWWSTFNVLQIVSCESDPQKRYYVRNFFEDCSRVKQFVRS